MVRIIATDDTKIASIAIVVVVVVGAAAVMVVIVMAIVMVMVVGIEYLSADVFASALSCAM